MVQDGNNECDNDNDDDNDDGDDNEELLVTCSGRWDSLQSCGLEGGSSPTPSPLSNSQAPGW